MTAGAVAVPTIVPLRPPISGKPKALIDTNTLIELHSDTQNADIYFTTNGSKPEPFQPHSINGKFTIKYKRPFRLPDGKRTVKAIAVASDGMRESNIMTKTFDVEYVEPDPEAEPDDGYNFVHDMNGGPQFNARKHAKTLMTKLLESNQAWTDVRGSKKSVPGTRWSDNRAKASSQNATCSENVFRSIEDPGADDVDPYTNKLRIPDTATQAMRLQRETDFLKCIYCFAPRPADPYARFCNTCGNAVPPLPQTRMPPPEPGTVGMCAHCKAVIPSNVSNCLVCEAPMGPQNQPMAVHRVKNKVVCNICGTKNPSPLTSCITCEAKLPINAKPVSGLASPPKPNQSDRLVSCTKCGRVNNPDARFCDWCGAKPSPIVKNMICSKCKGANQPYAKFCASCGEQVDPPRRTDYRNAGVSINFIDGDTGKTKHSMQPQWSPVAFPLPDEIRKPSSDIATQTVGLFYPSEKDLVKKQKEDDDKTTYEKNLKDRRPLLTSISPGRGFWRKQMDHVCAHLRAHAQNDAEFRALIGEPRMGKLLSGKVEEDGYEVCLTINFALRGNKDPFTGKSLGLGKGDFLSTLTEGRRGSMDSYRSENSIYSTGGGNKRRVKKKTKKPAVKTDKLSQEDRDLLKEIGKNGEGRVTEIDELVESGANTNCTNKDGLPILHVAAINRHVDAIPVLVQAGADVNKKGPQKGNSALHEAVTLGQSWGEVIDALLGCGAKADQKNDKGETPYDLAVKLNHDSLVKKLASNKGQNQLDRMLKSKVSSSVDMM